MKYYVIHSGEDMIPLARIVMGSITATNGTYIIYECDESNILTIEEVTQGSFVTHCIIADNPHCDN